MVVGRHLGEPWGSANFFTAHGSRLYSDSAESRAHAEVSQTLAEHKAASAAAWLPDSTVCKPCLLLVISECSKAEHPAPISLLT